MTKGKLTILIVDDDRFSRKLYSRTLTNMAPENVILETPFAEEGLELCRRHTIDCILLDYEMPDLDGLQFLERLKQRTKSDPIAVVMITGEGNQDIAAKALKAGAQEYLIKGSYSPELFLQTIRNAVKRVELDRRLKNRWRELENANERLKREIAQRARLEADLREIHYKFRTPDPNKQTGATRILLVSDDATTRATLSKLLTESRRQFEIMEAQSAQAGLDQCDTQNPDCVILCYDLAGMSAAEFLSHRYDASRNRLIPIITLGKRANEAGVTATLSQGARDYILLELMTGEYLMHTIANAMEKNRLIQVAETHRVHLKHITEQRARVEKDLQLFRDLVNQSEDSFFIAQPETGRLINFNFSLCHNLGYTADELSKKTMADLEVTENEENVDWKTRLAELKEKGSLTLELVHRRKDGTSFPVEIKTKYVILDDIPYLVSVARDITEHKEMEDRLRELSNMDGLTGIFNRRYFNFRLEKEWRRLGRNQNHLALIMIDVDHFKLYNDTYGHQAGDQCLKKLSRTMKECLNRPADFVARYGGEEFVIVLPETNREGAQRIAEITRSTVEALQLPHKSSPVGDHVTISLGVACVIPHGEDGYEVLIDKADRALYLTKDSGRNQVCVSPPD